MLVTDHVDKQLAMTLRVEIQLRIRIDNSHRDHDVKHNILDFVNLQFMLSHNI